MVTIQVMNMSVDAVHPAENFEDLTINEIETCVEFVLEVVLDHENAIQETHDHDHSSGKPVNPILLFTSLAFEPDFNNSFFVIPAQHGLNASSQVTPGFLMTFYPPPKYA